MSWKGIMPKTRALNINANHITLIYKKYLVNSSHWWINVQSRDCLATTCFLKWKRISLNGQNRKSLYFSGWRESKQLSEKFQPENEFLKSFQTLLKHIIKFGFLFNWTFYLVVGLRLNEIQMKSKLNRRVILIETSFLLWKEI